MTKSKFFSLIVCLTLLFGFQTNANASQTPRRAHDQRDPAILQQLITGNPIDFFLPSKQPEPSSMAQGWEVYFPVTWSRVAFQSFRYDNWDIYLMHPSGASEVRLTNSAATDSHPVLVKGGERVIFVSNRSGDNNIYAQNADGSGLAALTSGPANEIYPALAPDNSRIAYQSNAAGNYDIYVIGPGGTTQVTFTNAYDGEPTWAPDGNQLAFVSDRSGTREIWAMNADGSNLRQLTYNGSAATPAWSPNGDLIAYASDLNKDGFYSLYLMNVDGSNSTQAHYGWTNQDQWNPTWSPDGGWLAYTETNWIWPSTSTTWYWNSSNIVMFKVGGGAADHRPPTDGLTWKASWASTDATPPEPCTITLEPHQNWESFLVRWSAVDATAGLATYDVQVRDLPDGAWRDFMSKVSQPAGIYDGKNGQRYEFRCRGRDNAQNVAGWETAPVRATEVTTGYPTSQVSTLPVYVRGNRVTLHWQGNSANVNSYDIFVRDGEHGNWRVWLKGTSDLAGEFVGEIGHTYYFRSQARDAFQHIQVWQPEPQAMVTFYPVALSLPATDMRESPLPAPTFTLTPDPARAESNPQWVNSNGGEGVFPNWLRPDSTPVFVPLVSKPAPAVSAFALPSDWLTLGNDIQHSGYSPNQPGASRYALAWSFLVEQAQYVWPLQQVMVADGVVVVVYKNYSSPKLGIYAYDLSSGAELWYAPYAPTPISIANGALYFQASDQGYNHLFCLDLYSGQTIWRSQTTTSFDYYPLVVEEKIYMGSTNGLFSYDAASGTQLNHIGGMQSVSNWAPTYADGKIYTWQAQSNYPYNTSFFSEHNSASGAINWTLSLPWAFDDYSMNTAPVISKRTAFVVGTESLSAINLDTHALLWSIPGNYGSTLPAVAEDVVYAIHLDKLEARKVSNGELIGTFSASGNLIHSPVITGSDIYVSSADTTYLLDRATLNVKWTAPEGGWLSVSNGYLFIACSNGNLFVYRSQEP